MKKINTTPTPKSQVKQFIIDGFLQTHLALDTYYGALEYLLTLTRAGGDEDLLLHQRQHCQRALEALHTSLAAIETYDFSNDLTATAEAAAQEVAHE